MDRDSFIYNLNKNKEKITLYGSILLLIIISITACFVLFKKNIFNSSTEDAVSSTKYVLADNIITINYNGDIALYNSSNGKKMDTLKLDGEFLVDHSDDFTEFYLLNKSSKELNKITSNNNKIVKETKVLNVSPSINDFISFDYDNGNIVFLNKNKKEFTIKLSNSKNVEVINPVVENIIDSYKVVENNLIFTSGEYIGSANLLSKNENTNLKITTKELKLRTTTHENGELLLEIPMGEKIEIIKEEESGWVLIKYDDTEGYVLNSTPSFEDISKEVLKIHIGETSSYIHEIGNKIFIHNEFGKDRGISILLDINPNTLYINNLHKYSTPTKTFISNKNDTRIYTNEISMDDKEIKQMIKYSYTDEFLDNGAYSIESKSVIDNSNSYGSLGYVYYKDNNSINIFNIKSNEVDLTIETSSDFFAPIYKSK